MATSALVDTPTTPAAHLRGWDCIEWWVGNARTTAGFLMSAFGFRCTAYCGPGDRRPRQGQLRPRTGRHPLRRVAARSTPTSPIAEHVRRHGDGVHDLAWLVDDADAAFDAAVARGARAVRAPWTEDDANGTLRLAQVATYGETVHTFVDRTRYAAGLLEPGYTTERLPDPVQHRPVGLTRIDHVVGNVAQGELADWVRFYADVLGFARCSTSTTTRSAPSTRRSCRRWCGTARRS